MSKRRGNTEDGNEFPGLPDLVGELLNRATKNESPPDSQNGAKVTPTLFRLLSPEIVKNPRWKGQGNPPDVLREPLLTLSWDRAAGKWKWAVTDRVCNWRIGGFLDDLADGVQGIELALKEGRYDSKKIKTS